MEATSRKNAGFCAMGFALGDVMEELLSFNAIYWGGILFAGFLCDEGEWLWVLGKAD